MLASGCISDKEGRASDGSSFPADVPGSFIMSGSASLSAVDASFSGDSSSGFDGRPSTSTSTGSSVIPPPTISSDESSDEEGSASGGSSLRADAQRSCSTGSGASPSPSCSALSINFWRSVSSLLVQSTAKPSTHADFSRNSSVGYECSRSSSFSTGSSAIPLMLSSSCISDEEGRDSEGSSLPAVVPGMHSEGRGTCSSPTFSMSSPKL